MRRSANQLSPFPCALLLRVSDKFTINYWVVNGTNQVEATNGFKDELFGFTATPTKTISWIVNYYFGQEHPDRAAVTPTSPIPQTCFPDRGRSTPI